MTATLTGPTAPVTPAEQRPPADLMPKGKTANLMVVDDGAFANLLDTAKFEHIWRVATLFSKSNLVPQQFRDKPEDCFIATQMAVRLGVDPFMFMQKTYVVQGKPGMESQLAIALINTSGQFADPLDYEIEGEDPNADDYRVRCFAVRKSTGKVIYGPWVDWAVVKNEGWAAKGGSKWKTIPALMFQYRAAAWFGRTHCPERLMGMLTADELDDVATPPARQITAEVVSEQDADGKTKTDRLAETLAAGKAAKEAAKKPEEAAQAPKQEPESQPEESKAITVDSVIDAFATRNKLDRQAAMEILGEHSRGVIGKSLRKLNATELAALAEAVEKDEVKLES